MSNVDDKLDAAWRAASRESPPLALDDSIRAAARRAVSAGPSRARHMRSWPLAAAAVVAVLAVAIVALTPPEQATPIIVADNSPRQAAPEEQDAMPVPASPSTTGTLPRPAAQVPAPSAPVDYAGSAPRKQLMAPPASHTADPVLARVDKRRAEVPAAAGGAALDTLRPAPDRERAALQSKLEAPAPEAPATVGRAESFPATPMESKNAIDAPAAAPPPPAVAAASKPPLASGGAVSVAASRAARTSEAPAAGASPLLAKAAPEGERAKDAAPRPADEWVRLIRRLKMEGRNEEAAKELAAFRAAYKERADALLPPDLREAK